MRSVAIVASTRLHLFSTNFPSFLGIGQCSFLGKLSRIFFNILFSHERVQIHGPTKYNYDY